MPCLFMKSSLEIGSKWTSLSQKPILLHIEEDTIDIQLAEAASSKRHGKVVQWHFNPCPICNGADHSLYKHTFHLQASSHLAQQKSFPTNTTTPPPTFSKELTGLDQLHLMGSCLAQQVMCGSLTQVPHIILLNSNHFTSIKAHKENDSILLGDGSTHLIHHIGSDKLVSNNSNQVFHLKNMLHGIRALYAVYGIITSDCLWILVDGIISNIKLPNLLGTHLN